MHVELSDVSKGRRGIALPHMSLGYGNGVARLAVAETEQRPTVLGLIAAGRMTPDTGTVRIDGLPDRGALRRAQSRCRFRPSSPAHARRIAAGSVPRPRARAGARAGA